MRDITGQEDDFVTAPTEFEGEDAESDHDMEFAGDVREHGPYHSEKLPHGRDGLVADNFARQGIDIETTSLFDFCNMPPTYFIAYGKGDLNSNA